MMNLMKTRFCAEILLQRFHTSRTISTAIRQILPHQSEYSRLVLPNYWKIHTENTKIFSVINLNRSISNYSNLNQDKRSSQKAYDVATHHVDKLWLDFDEEEDLTQLLEDATKLLNTTEFKIIKTESAKDKLEHLVKYLCYCQCSPDNILHLLENNPQILSPSWSSLQQVFMILEEIGLRRGQLLKALDGHKALWESDIDMLRKRLGQLRQLGFGDDLRKAVIKWPPILTIQTKQMIHCIDELKRCDFSKGEIQTIVADHPQVLIDSPEDIAMKFQYVHFCMGITDGNDLVHGKIFNYSLDHIRTRHILLDRMGLFRTPDKHNIRSRKNPLLVMITNTTDKRFCSKVAAGISEEDLEIFRRNLNHELEEMGLRFSADTSDDSSVSEDDGYKSDETDDDEEEEYSEEYSDSDEDDSKRGYRR